MVHFEVTDVIRTVKYCNFSSYIMKLQYLKCILTRFFFQKSKLKKPSFHMRFTNPAHSAPSLKTWQLVLLTIKFILLFQLFSSKLFQRKRWQLNSWIREIISKPSDFSCQNYWTEIFELNSKKVFVEISL